MSIAHFSCVVPATAAFVAPLTASVTPANWNGGFTNAESPKDQIFSVSESGGVPGYTYAWSFQSGGAGLSFLTATNLTSVTVRASGTNATRSGVLRCIVTDSLGATAQDTSSINITFGTPP